MKIHSHRLAVSAVAILGLLSFDAIAGAGEGGFQSNLGDSFFQTQTPCKLKKFPTFETITPIPNIVDPFDQDFVPVFCQLRATNGEDVVKKAKGRWESNLFVLDHATGEFDSFPVASGTFNSGSSGIAQFEFDIPTEIFSDGFESGDVSAWSYTETDFTKKKGDRAEVLCNTGGSK